MFNADLSKKNVKFKHDSQEKFLVFSPNKVTNINCYDT